ncbi:hypothetical protein CTAYLR_004297 [Chrysophaeum taylorii]|uniref:Repressor of RNA polymerase III transcription n=1 Tax=Chrysophaeum taylorii TaxID=2483200 RepID=A0AAD7UE38_9STRA|nr:hypothetical protein CTAYLR_004297 [Chrysophaeum taylorii]
MKLLENPRLAAMTAFLTDRPVSERILSGRVEAFSCKRAGEDKKLSKKLEAQYNDELETSPSQQQQSPLGTLEDASTRRLLIDLISTMNASFPDHDFSSLRPDQFTRAHYQVVSRSINRHLSELGTEVLEELWAAAEEAVQLNECEVYSYVPDLDSDPFSADGIIWSFNYFFFNKSLKRIVYLTCVARPRYRETTTATTKGGRGGGGAATTRGDDNAVPSDDDDVADDDMAAAAAVDEQHFLADDP